MNKIIYQFCFHNHRTQFEMLERISYTLECYKEEMMDIHRYTYNLDFFKGKDEVILVDIIPHFMVPEIHSFDFDDYELESVMLEEYAREMIYQEELHLGEVDKMLRKPGDLSKFHA